MEAKKAVEDGVIEKLLIVGDHLPDVILEVISRKIKQEQAELEKLYQYAERKKILIDQLQSMKDGFEHFNSKDTIGSTPTYRDYRD